MIATVRIAAVMLVCSLAHAAGPGKQNAFDGRRVLVIGIDGMRPDVLAKANVPALRGLMDAGTSTNNAYAGGKDGDITMQPTSSGPGWATILTGRYHTAHGVKDNGTAPVDQPGGYQLHAAPHLAKFIKQTHPAASIVSIASWNWIDDYFTASQADLFDYRGKGIGATYPERDASVLDQALMVLADKNPDFLFVHFDQVDGAGHASGFTAANPDYVAALETVDKHVTWMLAALERRKNAEHEDWLVLVVTDHGGKGNGHGGQSEEERTVPMIACGDGIASRRVLDNPVGIHVVAATVLGYLGIPLQRDWGLSPEVFALAPQLEARPIGQSVSLAWTDHPRLAGVTGIDIQRDGTTIKTLAASTTTFTDTPPATGDTFRYDVVFKGTADVRAATVSIGRPADITRDLVLHLPFNGDPKDASGRGNHAAGPNARFSDIGKNNQALILNGTSTADIPITPDLNFGTSTDFTIALWVYAARQWTKDPAIITNKAWTDGRSPGWIIAGGDNLPSWQWNCGSPTKGRKDFDPPRGTGTIADGKWHLLTVVHKRGGDAQFFHDGKKIGSTSMASLGNVDTGKAIRLGRDTEGKFFPDQDILVDELRIWRRALSATEVADVFNTGG